MPCHGSRLSSCICYTLKQASTLHRWRTWRLRSSSCTNCWAPEWRAYPNVGRRVNDVSISFGNDVCDPTRRSVNRLSFVATAGISRCTLPPRRLRRTVPVSPGPEHAGPRNPRRSESLKAPCCCRLATSGSRAFRGKWRRVLVRLEKRISNNSRVGY